MGLLVGDPSQRIRRAIVTIDLTASVLAEAAERDADLIIAYHPPIFSGIKRFTKVPLVQCAASVGWVWHLQGPQGTCRRPDSVQHGPPALLTGP